MQTIDTTEPSFKESYHKVNEIRNEAVLVYEYMKTIDPENKISIFNCLSDLHRKKEYFVEYYEFLRNHIYSICLNDYETFVLENIIFGLSKFFEAIDTIIENYGGINSIEKLLTEKHFGFHSRNGSSALYSSLTESDPLGHQFFSKSETDKNKVDCTDEKVAQLTLLDLNDPKIYLDNYCKLKFVDEPDFTKISDNKLVVDSNVLVNSVSLESFMLNMRSSRTLNGLHNNNECQNNARLDTSKSDAFSGF